MNTYSVRFGKQGEKVTCNYRDAMFAFKRALEESKEHPAYIKYRGCVIAIVQRGGICYG